MNDRREPKRARQACLNCRRKKARCSGQKPVCAFCARLNQQCQWDDEIPDCPPYPSREVPNSVSDSAANLAARVALLESKLYLLGDESLLNPFTTTLQTSHDGRSHLPPSTQPANYDDPETTSERVAEVGKLTTQSDFATLPSRTTLLSLIDVYFESCHNQPYVYFHETSFRQRFEEGLLPRYLLYAFAATACRFSEHEFYRNRQVEAIAAYADASWSEIFQHSFSYEDSLELHMVQATSMLAVIDFTGWYKASRSPSHC